jgi:Immune inhibitor A peptidase M6
MRKVALAVAALLAIALVPAASPAVPRASVRASGSDVRELDPKAHHELSVSPQEVRELRRAAGARVPPVVGEERIWTGYDDAVGDYLKLYTLRGIGTNIEVWVASDSDDVSTGLEFPEGDCRNDGARNVITDEQVQYLIDEFDDTMYPVESAAFSVAPPRNGANAYLARLLELPRNYYRGPGDRIVALIDNVRDANFYDADNENGYSYIAGFYTFAYDFYFNRQVMSIDGFDWLHRTGANPPHEPDPNSNCATAPARPFLYEGTFAHEYQHLLENYVDPLEGNWVNEGISDYAQTITGYVDPRIPITQLGYDSHIQCFLGFLEDVSPYNPNPRSGGPENSMTLWGDQVDYESEVLCDYGAAYAFMEYLAGQFGHDALTALHLDEGQGLESLADVLTANGSSLSPTEVLTSWATMVAVDAALDDGWSLVGGTASEFRTPTLDASVNWDNDQSYAGPGVPPNGSDYVRLRDGAGAYLGVAAVESVEFDGATQLPKLPLEWTVDRNPPQGANKALYSGRGDNLDRSVARSVRVGNNGRLMVDLAWDTEESYDYAYVQVSDDGGETFRSVKCTDSIDAPLGPGFDGSSDGFTTQRCNLKRYAGERVILAFRYVTDGSVQEDGYWVGNVELDGRQISDGRSLQGWKSPTQINPVDVEDWNVRLVVFDQTMNQVRIANLTLDGDFDGSISGADLDALIGTTGATIAAIVTHLDGTETVLQTAPYTLTVNGVEQPGG